MKIKYNESQKREAIHRITKRIQENTQNASYDDCRKIAVNAMKRHDSKNGE